MFGFFWDYLKKFDLDGHKLDTIQFGQKKGHKKMHFSLFALRIHSCAGLSPVSAQAIAS